MGIREETVEHERSHPKVIEAMRRLGGAGRLRAMSDLIDSMRTITAAGVRQQHPDWTPEQVAAETARRVARANA